MATVNTRQAADYLNLSPRTLEYWRVYGGGPPFHKIGRSRVSYETDDLDAFKRAGRRTSTSDPGPAGRDAQSAA